MADQNATLTNESMDNESQIMVFHPSMDEFKNFNEYIRIIEKSGAHHQGIAKIVPPKEWVPRKKSYDEEDIMSLIIPSPIRQIVKGNCGIYNPYSLVKKSRTVAQFKLEAESDRYKTPVHENYDDLENIYWKTIKQNAPIYGADVSGSVTDDDVNVWNIGKLGSILDLMVEDYDQRIEGVNTPYLYFGMWKATFSWHTEDMDLYSINFIHNGSPKTWYAIPPKYGRSFEKIAAKLYPEEANNCAAFLRHKSCIIAPHILEQNSIPFNKIVQKSGEIIINFPYGYHSGFNHGFNIAEAVNFATDRWVEYGKRTTQCNCYQNCIKINMDTFVKKLQPERYDLWLNGEDMGCHPEDDTLSYPAPVPEKRETSATNNDTSTEEEKIIKRKKNNTDKRSKRRKNK